MDAIKYLKEEKRMFNSIGRKKGRCEGVGCNICPLEKSNNGIGCGCVHLKLEYPEVAVAIVEKWSLENPQKTMLQDFLEKYPNAKLKPSGLPYGICPEDLGYCEKRDCRGMLCKDCWNRPLEG